jgi:probable HAF family extracellular repeat protein
MRRERHWALALLSAALSLIVATTAAAQTPTYTFTPINVPEAREVFLTGINNAGQIVGYYEDSAYHGLFYSDGTSFTTIDVAGYGYTVALGINNTGQIVGRSGGDGFLLYSDGTLTTFNVPGSGYPGYIYTEGSSINDLGQIVGDALYDNGEDIYTHDGFLYSGGSFTTIDAPDARQFYGDTYPRGINNAGQIVGYFDGGGGPGEHGYLLDTDGSYTTIDLPGSTDTWVYGINNVGQIVGTFYDSQTTHGFLYVGGSVTLIDVPGALFTYAFAVNDLGQIVVWSWDGTRYQWFVATPAQSPDLARLLGGPSTNQPNNKMGGSKVFTSPAKSNR